MLSRKLKIGTAGLFSALLLGSVLNPSLWAMNEEEGTEEARRITCTPQPNLYASLTESAFKDFDDSLLLHIMSYVTPEDGKCPLAIVSQHLYNLSFDKDVFTVLSSKKAMKSFETSMANSLQKIPESICIFVKRVRDHEVGFERNFNIPYSGKVSYKNLPSKYVPQFSPYVIQEFLKKFSNNPSCPGRSPAPSFTIHILDTNPDYHWNPSLLEHANVRRINLLCSERNIQVNWEGMTPSACDKIIEFRNQALMLRMIY